MTKSLQVKMPDGSVWRVPLEKIAEHRANRILREVRKGGPSNTADGVWKKAFDEGMNKVGMLTLWAADEMDWDDVANVALNISPAPPPDYQMGWVNGRHEVVAS